MKGYVNSTLAVFNTDDFGDPSDREYYGPNVNTSDQFAVCRYRAFRAGPDEPEPYTINEMWLHVFTARLGFIVIFEASVAENQIIAN